MSRDLYDTDEMPAKRPIAMKWIVLTLGAAVGLAAFSILRTRRFAASEAREDEFGFTPNEEQAVIVRATPEEAEAGWVKWCTSGHARLNDDYAVRFEPKPAAHGTEVVVSRGGSKGTIREELRQFKQVLETETAAEAGLG